MLKLIRVEAVNVLLFKESRACAKNREWHDARGEQRAREERGHRPKEGVRSRSSQLVY